MKALTLLLCASLLAIPVLAQNPTPAPPGLNVADNPFSAATPAPVVVQPVIVQPAAEFQSQAISWINAIVVVLGVVATVLLPAIAVLWSRVRDITKRQDRQAEKQGQIDSTVRQALAAAPPTAIAVAAKAPLVALLLMFFATACSTTTSDPAVNARNAGLNAAGSQALREAARFIGSAAVAAITSAVQQETSGGKVDYHQAAAAALYANVNAVDTISGAKRIVTAFSAGKATQTATAAARAMAAAQSMGTPAPQAVSAIAATIFTATGAPPKS
jgi:uncharacterized membrane protein YhaH (DUF805 family)